MAQLSARDEHDIRQVNCTCFGSKDKGHPHWQVLRPFHWPNEVRRMQEDHLKCDGRSITAHKDSSLLLANSFALVCEHLQNATAR